MIHLIFKSWYWWVHKTFQATNFNKLTFSFQMVNQFISSISFFHPMFLALRTWWFNFLTLCSLNMFNHLLILHNFFNLSFITLMLKLELLYYILLYYFMYRFNLFITTGQTNFTVDYILVLVCVGVNGHMLASVTGSQLMRQFGRFGKEHAL